MVTGEIKEQNIGYIKITSFSKGTAKETETLLKKFGTNKIIIDLCDNPGGSHEELMGLFDIFAPEGPVLQVNNNTYFSSNRCFGKYRTVILVNKNSASASEAFAGTMKDLGAAGIVGERTYGKGTFSCMSEAKRHQGIVLSKGIYTTAKGTKINGIGVIPDIKTQNTDESLKTAINLLCNKTHRK